MIFLRFFVPVPLPIFVPVPVPVPVSVFVPLYTYSNNMSHTATIWHMLPARTKKWNTECM